MEKSDISPMPAKVPMVPVKQGADEHYRYKMRRLMTRSKSAGNGIKTVILNAGTIARAIYRTPAALTQWFGYAIAVQAKYVADHDHIILNGEHDAKKLQTSLYEFIEYFVLCPACTNPETTMVVQDKVLRLQCSPCGNMCEPQSHKTAFTQKMAAWFSSHVKTEGKPTVTRVDKRPTDMQDGGSIQVESSHEVSLNIDKLMAISKQFEDQQNNGGAKAAQMSQEEEDAFLKQWSENCRSDMPDAKLYEQFTQFGDKLSLPPSARVAMLVSCLFDEHPTEILSIIVKRRTLMIRVAMEEELQKELLYLLSHFVCAQVPTLFTSAPIIWYTLFDNEIVEEEALKEWLARASTRREKDKDKATQLRAMMKPFFTWLAEAPYEGVPDTIEEEDEDEAAEEAEPEDELNLDDI